MPHKNYVRHDVLADKFPDYVASMYDHNKIGFLNQLKIKIIRIKVQF